jgi:hypothetical protein
MSIVASNELPDGAVAYQQYEVSMPSGATATVGVTLGDMEDDTDPAALARARGATSHGLVVLVGMVDAPQLPIVWMSGERPGQVRLGLSVLDQQCDLNDEIKDVIGRVLGTFLEEVATLTDADPPSSANDNHTVH